MSGMGFERVYSTAEVAEHVGVSKNTLLRWISEGRLRDVDRDWRNWRLWREADVARARALRERLHEPERVASPSKSEAMPVYAAELARLGQGREQRVK